MKFSITLAHEIAKTHNWTGTRRRTVTLPDGETRQAMVFGRKPVVIDWLPKEVAADPKLIVVEVPEDGGPAGDSGDPKLIVVEVPEDGGPTGDSSEPKLAAPKAHAKGKK